MSIPFSLLATTAMGNLRGKPQRTLLALLGISVGIGSVTALISTGAIARNEALRQFESLGTDIVAVYGFNRDSSGGTIRSQFGLTREDTVGFSSLNSVADLAPFVLYSSEIQNAREEFRAQVVGSTSPVLSLLNLELEDGRFLSRMDGTTPYAVLGFDIAQALRKTGLSGNVGDRIKIKNTLFTIIGTLKNAVRGPTSIRPNEAVFIPLGHAQRTVVTRDLTGCIVRMQPEVHYSTATAEIEDHLGRVAPHLEVRVDSPVGFIEQMEAQMRLLAILLGAVGGISLIVGGFGVMNAMLASVSEQRLEIGIRRAIGAKRIDIRNQVLVESSILCLTGGALGFVIGVVATLLISYFAGWSWQFSWGSLGLGVLIAVAIGVFFGYYPARQASMLDPIVALRKG